MNQKTRAVLIGLFLAGAWLATNGREAQARQATPNITNAGIAAWFQTHSIFAVGIGILLMAIAVLGVYHERKT